MLISKANSDSDSALSTAVYAAAFITQSGLWDNKFFT